MKYKYSIGDKVIFINEQGINCGEKTITELSERTNKPCYFVEPTTTSWFPVSEKNLHLPGSNYDNDMTTAKTIPDAVLMKSYGELPNGVRYIEIEYDGTHEAFKNAPNALSLNNLPYGKASHNSDTFKIVYRTDVVVAKKVK
jgi:hypothetical protein